MIKAKHLYDSDEKLKLFGYGEWIEEPDGAEFKWEGFSCAILRNDFGCWCGYIRVPEKHPWYFKDYFSIEADVHGGLTFSEYHDFNGKLPDMKGFWIGFDCGHGNDFCPLSVKSHRELDILMSESIPEATKIRRSHMFERISAPPYRNFEYVVNETKKLATQAKHALEKVNDPPR